jgi:hypothetical protein
MYNALRFTRNLIDYIRIERHMSKLIKLSNTKKSKNILNSSQR